MAGIKLIEEGVKAVETVAKKVSQYALPKAEKKLATKAEAAAKATPKGGAAKTAETTRKEARVSAPKTTPTEDRVPVAPFVQTKGHEPLIQKILEHAERVREPNYPMATEPVFKPADTALTKELVPQVSIQHRLPPYPDPNQPFPLKDRARLVHEHRAEIAQLIARHLSGQPRPFYSTGTVLQGLIDKGGLSPEEAMTFMDDWAGQGAAMSPQTKTPPNIRNAGYSLWRQAQGDPVTPEKWLVEGNRPGFPMIGNMHPRLSQEFFTGTENPWKNPKPSTFKEAWKGNMSNVVADQHNILATLDFLDRIAPGQVPRGWFEGTKAGSPAYDAYIAGGGFPSTGRMDEGMSVGLKGAQVGGLPAQTEYPILQGPTYDAAKMLGISPSEAQERMWFDFGGRTGLQSPEMTIPDLFNSQFEATSGVTGLHPEDIMRLFMKRKIPLAEADMSDVPGFATTA